MSAFAIGDEVEWDVISGVDRGKVSAVTETRVYVHNQHIRRHGRNAGTQRSVEPRLVDR